LLMFRMRKILLWYVKHVQWFWNGCLKKLYAVWFSVTYTSYKGSYQRSRFNSHCGKQTFQLARCRHTQRQHASQTYCAYFFYSPIYPGALAAQLSEHAPFTSERGSDSHDGPMAGA
jgi:hypothetical protein